MNGTETSTTTKVEANPPDWLIYLVIALFAGVVFLAGWFRTAAKIIHSILLCFHIITICYLPLYGALLQGFAKERGGMRIWRFLIPLIGGIALCALASRNVVFAARWDARHVVIATLFSGFGFAIDLFILYFLTPRITPAPRINLGTLWKLIRRFQHGPLVEKYNALVAEGNYREALEVLQPELKCRYPDAVSIMLAGSMNLKLGQVEEGIRLLQDGLSKSDRDANTLALVAWLYHYTIDSILDNN